MHFCTEGTVHDSGIKITKISLLDDGCAGARQRYILENNQRITLCSMWQLLMH